MGDDVIVKKCLDLIDEEGKKTLTSDNFAELRPETVMTIVTRDSLDIPTEVVVWKACITWAEAQCRRQGKLVRTRINLRLLHL